jgi:hypothetical protein
MYDSVPPRKTFTRLFTCPTTSNTFQAEIVMSGSVEDVVISGLHEPEDADAKKDES